MDPATARTLLALARSRKVRKIVMIVMVAIVVLILPFLMIPVILASLTLGGTTTEVNCIGIGSVELPTLNRQQRERLDSLLEAGRRHNLDDDTMTGIVAAAFKTTVFQQDDVFGDGRSADEVVQTTIPGKPSVVLAQFGQGSVYVDDGDSVSVAKLLVSDAKGTLKESCTMGSVGEMLPNVNCAPSRSPAERGLKPAALSVLRCVAQEYPQIKSYGGVGPRPNASDHPAGRAVDVMIPAWNTTAGNQLGWTIARWLEANREQLRVKYLIYAGRIWRASAPERGWTAYRHPTGRTNPTLDHYDHVHVSVFR